jgi:excisionase family DNA binding protein
MSNDKPLKTYTTSELAKLFNKDVATIRRWIKNGDLPAVKIGGSYYIEEETLRRILRGEKPQENKE